MEQRNQRRVFPSKQCQVDGCEEISVGSKVPLCRKHRNKTYKQNYKKKKRNAGANNEEKEIVIDDQYLLEQKYSNMLHDVLSQKQMELFESPSVVSLLKNYQTHVAPNSSKSSSGFLPNGSKTGQSNPVEQQPLSEGLSVSSNSVPKFSQEIDQSAFTSSLNYTQYYTGDWDTNRTHVSSNTSQNTSLICRTSIVQQTPGAPYDIPVTSSFHVGVPQRKWFPNSVP